MKYPMSGDGTPQFTTLCGRQARKGSIFTNLQFGVGSIDNTLKGVRCQAAHDVRSTEGKIESSTHGTIVFELVGKSYHLVNVYWDQGLDSFVSPQDIVVTESSLIWH